MAIGVGILVVAQAGTSPGGAGAKAAPALAVPATAAGAGTGDTDAPAAEAPATPASSDATLRFRNDVGDAFQLGEARFTLDGHSLPALLTTVLHGQDYVIFNGPLAPGRHVLTSHVTYQGRSRSIFTYMKGYIFTLDTTHELNVPDSGAMSATVVGKPNKGFNVPFEKSLLIDLEQPAALGGAR